MKRYVAEWKNMKIVLDEDDYKKLLERFDLNNFVEGEWSGGLYLTNQTPCPLCEAYFNCKGCPFDLYPQDTGCVKIIAEALKETIEKPFLVMNISRGRINLVVDIEKGKQIVALLRELLVTKFKVVEE